MAAVLPFALGACGGQAYAPKADEVFDMPTDYGAYDVDGVEPRGWCSDFGHEELDRLVRSVWSDSLEMRAAWARVRQARAVAEGAEAPLWPSVDAEAGVDSTKRYFGGFGGRIPVESEVETTWSLSAAASYEVDVWGRHRRRAEAADLDVLAVEEDARSLAMTLTSLAAEAWFDVVAQRERLALLREQAELSEALVDVVGMRFSRGIATGLDITQQEQNAESLRAQLSSARAVLETSRNQLAVLLGRAPSEAVEIAAEALPSMPPLPDPGVPADLLERRPDVRAALLRLRAHDERTAAAVADRFPRLGLSANVFLQATSLGDLFKRLFWNVFAGLSQSLWDGGRMKAEVERSEAIAEEQLYLYAQTLLTAMREVGDALVLEAEQEDRIASLRRQLDSASEALEVARRRYRAGGLDYLRVLTALQSLQGVEQSLLEARRQRFSHRISQCRALGGSWTRDLEAPDEAGIRSPDSCTERVEGGSGPRSSADSRAGVAQLPRAPNRCVRHRRWARIRGRMPEQANGFRLGGTW